MDTWEKKTSNQSTKEKKRRRKQKEDKNEEFLKVSMSKMVNSLHIIYIYILNHKMAMSTDCLWEFF